MEEVERGKKRQGNWRKGRDGRRETPGRGRRLRRKMTRSEVGKRKGQ